MTTPLRVIKVGGSLFDMPNLDDRLQGFMDEQSRFRNLLVAGGGALVEAVRKLDAVAPIDEDHAHWMCIDLMSITAKLLATRLAIKTISTVEEFPADSNPCAAVFDPSSWLRQAEPHSPGTKLPVGWQVTSDSIAARLAVVLAADELAMLKSTLPASKNLQKMADAGYVDRAFPMLAGELAAFRFVDLRHTKSLRMR